MSTGIELMWKVIGIAKEIRKSEHFDHLADTPAAGLMARLAGALDELEEDDRPFREAQIKRLAQTVDRMERGLPPIRITEMGDD